MPCHMLRSTPAGTVKVERLKPVPPTVQGLSSGAVPLNGAWARLTTAHSASTRLALHPTPPVSVYSMSLRRRRSSWLRHDSHSAAGILQLPCVVQALSLSVLPLSQCWLPSLDRLRTAMAAVTFALIIVRLAMAKASADSIAATHDPTQLAQTSFRLVALPLAPYSC